VKRAGWSTGLLLELKGNPPCSKADQRPLNLSLLRLNAPQLANAFSREAGSCMGAKQTLASSHVLTGVVANVLAIRSSPHTFWSRDTIDTADTSSCWRPHTRKCQHCPQCQVRAPRLCYDPHSYARGQCPVELSAHSSPRGRKPALPSVTAASLFSRSRADRASRSRASRTCTRCRVLRPIALSPALRQASHWVAKRSIADLGAKQETDNSRSTGTCIDAPS
jgi:hypothetical protein